MSKIMSAFEKLNLVEKTNQKKDNISGNENVYVKQKLDSKTIDEGKNEAEPKEKAQINENRKFSIQEIYTSHSIENSDINTIFMLGNFINALPDSLPYEVRKESLINIVASSHMDLTNLLDDGKKRLDALGEFSSSYYNSASNIVEEYKKKIAELKKQINSYEEQISFNENLLKEQNNTIKYEMDKIDSIINFFNNGD